MSAASTVTTEQQRSLVREWLGSGAINVFGVQFAGKDTQLKRLASWTGGVVMGGGEISRAMISRLPEHVQKITNAGGLIPIDEYLKMVIPYFSRAELNGKPLLLSAVGRWHGEEEGVMQAAQASQHPMRAVIWLELDEATVWKRWHLMHDVQDRDHRVDDTEDGLKKRLDEYRNKTLPCEDYYRERGLLVSVDGSQSPDEVEQAILDRLYEKAVSEKADR